MINNYFKVGKHEIFPFNDTDLLSTANAYEAAQRKLREYPDSRLSVFRKTPSDNDHAWTRYVVGESPSIPEYSEVVQWTSTGWVTRARDLGQGRSGEERVFS